MSSRVLRASLVSRLAAPRRLSFASHFTWIAGVGAELPSGSLVDVTINLDDSTFVGLVS